MQLVAGVSAEYRWFRAGSDTGLAADADAGIGRAADGGTGNRNGLRL